MSTNRIAAMGISEDRIAAVVDAFAQLDTLDRGYFRDSPGASEVEATLRAALDHCRTLISNEQRRIQTEGSTT